MTRSLLTAAVLVVAFAFALSGCCNSILCNVKKAATEDLACPGEDLQVSNVTSQVSSGHNGAERYLRVEGCGKQAQYTCEPTNLEAPRKKKYREEVIVPQSRLDLRWQCQPSSNLAQK